MRGERTIKVILSRFKECSEYKHDITFNFCSGYITTLQDIKKAINEGVSGNPIPFGDTDTYIPMCNRDINYHIQRVIYFVYHSEKIKDIKIKSAWWIQDNILHTYPHIKIEDGYHRIAAAFYLKLKYVEMSNYDYIRTDIKNYITGVSDVKPNKSLGLILE